MKKQNVVETEEFIWEEVPRYFSKVGLSEDNIIVSYQLKQKHKGDGIKPTPLLVIRFGENVLKKLHAKEEDRLILMQAQDNLYNYLLIKANNGYKIRPYGGYGYEISFKFDRKGLNYFSSQECQYIANRGGSVRIIFPEIKVHSK